MSFEQIYYKGKPMKRDLSAKVTTMIMQKNNPNRLDMRYKVNKEFAKLVGTHRVEVRSDVPPGMIYFLSDKWQRFNHV